MSKIRINDLARELEVKSKAILDVLSEVGVTEKKTHSSSLEDFEAEKVRAHFHASQPASAAAQRQSRSEPGEIKTKIDLSHISKPGDVLKAIINKQQPAAPAKTGITDDTIEQLRKLGELHEQGILTDDEFQQQKQSMLRSM